MTHFRQAVNDMCKQCIYDERAEGNWRQQVAACTSTQCPLYPLRPVSTSKKKKAVKSSENSQIATSLRVQA